MAMRMTEAEPGTRVVCNPNYFHCEKGGKGWRRGEIVEEEGFQPEARGQFMVTVLLDPVGRERKPKLARYCPASWLLTERFVDQRIQDFFLQDPYRDHVIPDMGNFPGEWEV